MKRMVCLFAVVLMCLALVGVVNATPNEKFNWGPMVGPAAQGPPAGAKLVLNINMQVTGDPDSGFHGYWATDEYNKHIQVWETSPGNFYADVKYIGSFTTKSFTDNPDLSPQDGVVIPEGIDGNMEGGYQLTFSGSLSNQTDFKTKGNIGNFNYGGLNDTNDGPKNPFDWVGTFFNATNIQKTWWGWQYHTGQNGTWVNASDGSHGDITP